MSALDQLLDLTGAFGASALVLRPGQTPQFQTASGFRPAAKNVLDEALIVRLVRELAEVDEQHLIDERTPVHFAYRGFTVDATFADGGAEARISTGEPGQQATAAPPLRPVLVREQPPAESAPPITALFRAMNERGASDLHLKVGSPPNLRLHGDLVPLDGPPLTPERIADLLWPICPDRNRREWEADHDTDFGYEVPGLARFRCNYLMDRGGLGAVFRQIPTQIPSVEELGLAPQVVDLCWLSKGFVTVTGPTGSGKSTTLAALVDHINRNRSDHIITIEDPIEFVHAGKKCVVTQREVGSHTQDFRRALRAALREDPDIVLVGEMRDLETIAIAIETAETGHLVFGTLHTTTAASTIDRIIDQFPADRQGQIRVMLSESLKAVIAQTLCKRIGGGRVAAFEILIVNNAVSNLIREAKTFQIPSVMQTQKANGNVPLNDSLLDLVKKGIVEAKDAYIKAVDKTSLMAMFERSNISFDARR
jgi:twitching motility protein PilT